MSRYWLLHNVSVHYSFIADLTKHLQLMPQALGSILFLATAGFLLSSISPQAIEHVFKTNVQQLLAGALSG